MRIYVYILFILFSLMVAVLAAFGVVYCFHPPPKSPSRGGLDCRPSDGVASRFTLVKRTKMQIYCKKG